MHRLTILALLALLIACRTKAITPPEAVATCPLQTTAGLGTGKSHQVLLHSMLELDLKNNGATELLFQY